MCPRHHSNGFPLGSNGLFPPGGSGGFSSPKPETMFSNCRTVISDFRESVSGRTSGIHSALQTFVSSVSGLMPALAAALKSVRISPNAVLV